MKPHAQDSSAPTGFALDVNGRSISSHDNDPVLIWRHLDGNSETDLSWLSEHSNLDSVVIKALTAEDTRPRYAPGDAGALLIYRDINLEPGSDPEDMVSLRLWCDGDRLISVARRRVMAVEELSRTIGKSKNTVKVADLLVGLTEILTNRIRETVRTIEETVDTLEEKLIESSRTDFITELNVTRRQTIWLKRFVDPQCDALSDLLQNPPKWLGKHQLARLRETADATLRVKENLVALREHIAMLQDHLRIAGEEKVRDMTYLLTLVAGVFLPLNLLAGLFGANVGGIPGTDNPWGFLSLVSAIILVGAVGTFYLMRAK